MARSGMIFPMVLALVAAQQAAPAPASSVPTEADIEAMMQRALAPPFQAFGNCITTGIEAASRRGPVSRAAARIVSACRPQQQALVAAHAAFLDDAPLTDAQRAQSRRAWAETQRTLPGQIEAALTSLRQQPPGAD